MERVYGVSGMMEWVALIPAGKNVLKVRFRGGASSGYGVPLATFATTSPAVMRIIEGSAFFRNGRIRHLHDNDEIGINHEDANAASRKQDPEKPR